MKNIFVIFLILMTNLLSADNISKENFNFYFLFDTEVEADFSSVILSIKTQKSKESKTEIFNFDDVEVFSTIQNQRTFFKIFKKSRSVAKFNQLKQSNDTLFIT